MIRLLPSHVHVGFVTVGLALCALFVAQDGPVGISAVLLSSLLPAGLLLAMLLRGRITAPMPWWFVVGGLTSLSVHNAVALQQVGFEGRATATGAVSLLTLPLGYVGLLVAAVLMSFRYARKDIGGIIDGAVIGLCAASLLWSVAVAPALVARDAGTGSRMYSLVVILLVSGIAGAVVRAWTTSRLARPALAYLLLAVLTTLGGNVARAMTTAPDGSGSARWVGLVWIVGYLALAAAAAHPAHVHLSTPERQATGRLSRRRVAFLGASLALNPALAGLETVVGVPTDIPLLVVGSLLVVALVMTRVAQLADLHATAESRLEHLATHDVLTDLPNRRAIDQHLEAAVHRVSRGTSTGVSVLFVDLDDFKTVNDTLGHHLGDRLLEVVAARLRTATRAGDLVGRFGGDEFVVVVEGDPATAVPEVRARIEDALAAPVDLDGATASARASIGAACAGPGSTLTAEQLLSAADARMYDEKRAERAPRV